MPVLSITTEEFNALLSRIDLLEKKLSDSLNMPLALEWVTLDQARILLQLKSYQTVSKMCKADKLEYKQDGRTIQVKLDSIRKYNQSKQIN